MIRVANRAHFAIFLKGTASGVAGGFVTDQGTVLAAQVQPNLGLETLRTNRNGSVGLSTSQGRGSLGDVLVAAEYLHGLDDNVEMFTGVLNLAAKRQAAFILSKPSSQCPMRS
jgi:hypothetical protein